MYRVTLEAARVNVHMTQKEVAEKLRKSLSTIRNWESGRSVPDALEFQELCNLYKAPAEAIVLQKV